MKMPVVTMRDATAFDACEASGVVDGSVDGSDVVTRTGIVLTPAGPVQVQCIID